jgi:hypothetical protein
MALITSQNFFQVELLGAEEAVCVRRTKAAQMLAISVSTLDRLVKAGELTCLKLPGCVLFRVDTLRAWASRRESCDEVGGRITERPTNSNNTPAA